MSEKTVSVALHQVVDYQFDVRFGDLPQPWRVDEPAPLGQGQGPSPSQLLAAAVGNCLSDSLLFALRKFKQAPEPISAQVDADIGRNPEGRLRVLALRVELRLGVPAAQLAHLDRALAQFESFCTVSQSVGQGIPITVGVRDATGAVLK